MYLDLNVFTKPSYFASICYQGVTKALLVVSEGEWELRGAEGYCVQQQSHVSFKMATHCDVGKSTRTQLRAPCRLYVLSC